MYRSWLGCLVVKHQLLSKSSEPGEALLVSVREATAGFNWFLTRFALWRPKRTHKQKAGALHTKIIQNGEWFGIAQNQTSKTSCQTAFLNILNMVERVADPGFSDGMPAARAKGREPECCFETVCRLCLKMMNTYLRSYHCWHRSLQIKCCWQVLVHCIMGVNRAAWVNSLRSAKLWIFAACTATSTWRQIQDD